MSSPRNTPPSPEHTHELDVTGAVPLVAAKRGADAPPSDSELDGLHLRIQELEETQTLLEEQIRQLHRAKTVSDLLAGVAHDLSGALTGILWCSEALRRRVDALDADLSAGLADFVTAAEYARRLARRLISIARQREGDYTPVRIQDAVDQSLALLDSLRPAKVQLSAALSAPDAHVWGSADELQQVLMNLVTNAFDAVSARGGRVYVELGPTSEMTHEHGWICLRVRDTGHGMSPETLRRAFEPFFTTKSAHGGNGLGLVVVQAIVQRHGGKVVTTSALGVGTTIDVLLPLSTRPAAP